MVMEEGMNRKVKQVVGFLLLKGAFTSRNITSIGLVLLFFGIYVASGGKLASLPNVSSTNQFGGVSGAVKINSNTAATEATNKTANSYDDPSARLFNAPVQQDKARTIDLEGLGSDDEVVAENEDERLDNLLNRLEGMDE